MSIELILAGTLNGLKPNIDFQSSPEYPFAAFCSKHAGNMETLKNSELAQLPKLFREYLVARKCHKSSFDSYRMKLADIQNAKTAELTYKADPNATEEDKARHQKWIKENITDPEILLPKIEVEIRYFEQQTIEVLNTLASNINRISSEYPNSNEVVILQKLINNAITINKGIIDVRKGLSIKTTFNGHQRVSARQILDGQSQVIDSQSKPIIDRLKKDESELKIIIDKIEAIFDKLSVVTKSPESTTGSSNSETQTRITQIMAQIKELEEEKDKLLPSESWSALANLFQKFTQATVTDVNNVPRVIQINRKLAELKSELNILQQKTEIKHGRGNMSGVQLQSLRHQAGLSNIPRRPPSNLAPLLSN